MELFLNIAWLLVAGAILCLWLRGEGRNQPDRWRQLIALAVLIAILFPVISVSDDLMAVQNAFETDNDLRRDHLIPANPHPVQPVLTMLAEVILAAITFAFQRFAAPGALPVKEPQQLFMVCIENRPPPAA